MPRKRKPKIEDGAESDPGCGPKSDPDCGERPFKKLKVEHSVAFLKKANRILDEQEAQSSGPDRNRFVHVLEWAAQRHEVFSKRWKNMVDREGDIIALINQSVRSGDVDEAVWRCFLAAHFGRSSAQGGVQIPSAAKFLCSFGKSPRWTWEKVAPNPKMLREWLTKNRDDLATLGFGNHRKFESQKPKILWTVIKSFFDLAHEYGGPADLIGVNDDSVDDPFNILYKRLQPLKRFGRTGRFDFLVLLRDLGLINAEPKKCYLRGATGPLDGAKLLWGDWDVNDLEEAAAELSERLRVSPQVMEDALCCWQK